MVKKKVIFKIAVTLFLFFGFLLSNVNPLYSADSNTVALDNLIDALNDEISLVFEPFVDMDLEFEEMTDANEIFELFQQNINNCRPTINRSLQVYKKYSTNSYDYEITNASQLASRGSNKGLLAMKAYENFLESGADEDLIYYADKGDDLMQEYVELHDQAVDVLNDYSGYSEATNTRNALNWGATISLLISLFLFFKSRDKSHLKSDLIRKKVYKELLKDSIWLTAGVGITAISYNSTFTEGGTYYILYGPMLAGGWGLLKGISWYFQEGKKQLALATKEEKRELLKKSYQKKTTTKDKKIKKGKKCPHCSSKQAKTAIICNKCGKNVL